MRKGMFSKFGKTALHNWRPKLVSLIIAVLIWIMLKEQTQTGFIDEMMHFTWTTSTPR